MRGLVVKEIHSQLPNLNLGGVSLYKYIPGIPAVMKSTSVYSPCLLGVNLHPINPDRLSNQCRAGADRCAPMLPR